MSKFFTWQSGPVLLSISCYVSSVRCRLTFTAKNIGVGVILLISRSVFLLVESTIVALHG